MKNYIVNIVFKNFPSDKSNIEGVYKINNEYVGASTNIRGRISSHYKLAFDNLERLMRESKKELKFEDIINHKYFSNGGKTIMRSYLTGQDIVVEFLDGIAENEYKYKKRSRGETFYHENPSHKNKCKCGVCSLMRRIQSLPYVY
jgi:hypothetical protein